IVTCRAEHSSVVAVCKHLESKGWQVTFLPTDPTGRVEPDRLADALGDRTVLVSIMAANNETGTIQPIEEIAALTRPRGILLHCDATQAAGKTPIDVEAMGIDLLSLSAHKIYGPKGVGCLYVRSRRPRVRLACQMHGGGHENGLRSGTLNVPGIVAFGAAAEICLAELAHQPDRLRALRDRLHEHISGRLDGVQLNGHPTERLCNTLNLSFAHVEGEALMMKLRNLAVSSGSACASESHAPSHVLTAMGVPENLASSAIRFSLGRHTTAEEIDYAAEQVVRAVEELRRLSPLYEQARKRPPGDGPKVPKA
ncbi:MAG: cysteine desulfurase, partial [Planctomycetes bacterium]|nr:cysteine desulfurase [Planctomycetota bacterium]